MVSSYNNDQSSVVTLTPRTDIVVILQRTSPIVVSDVKRTARNCENLAGGLILVLSGTYTDSLGPLRRLPPETMACSWRPKILIAVSASDVG